MLDRNDHLTRAKQNEILASQLNADHGVSVDWAVTMIFYSARHTKFLEGQNRCRANATEQISKYISGSGPVRDICRRFGAFSLVVLTRPDADPPTARFEDGLCDERVR